MKKLIFLLFLITSCNQENNLDFANVDSSKNDLEEIFELSSRNLSLADTIQRMADEKTSEKISKTVETISTLKSENKNLKNKLNEVTKKLDDITNSDNNVQFKLLPISNDKENR